MDEDKKTDELVEEKSVVTLDDLSADELRNIVRETRSEAKTYRVSLRELQKEKEQLDAVKRKEADDKLKEKGKFEELLNAKEKELADARVKADAFEQLRTSEIEEAKKLLGEKWDDEYGNLSLTSLRKTVQLLSKKEKVPGTDNGEHPSDPPKTQLSDAQKREAIEKFPYMEKDKAEAAWEHVLRKTGKIK